MEIPKYAQLENERRFLVIDGPDLSLTPSALIDDIYFPDTRLRLRSVTHPSGERAFKLCKKYDSPDPVSGPIVNIYLSGEEHATLSRLPGRPLRKRRYRISWRDSIFGIDVFEGALEGLTLCEKAAGSADAIRALAFPPWAAREVTGDTYFTGGNLATLTASALQARLSTDAGGLPAGPVWVRGSGLSD